MRGTHEEREIEHLLCMCRSMHTTVPPHPPLMYRTMCSWRANAAPALPNGHPAPAARTCTKWMPAPRTGSCTEEHMPRNEPSDSDTVSAQHACRDEQEKEQG